MNTQRLLELADFLDTVPPEHFDIGYWWTEEDWDLPETPVEIPENVDDSLIPDGACQTAGCALGWACSYKPFIEQGLYMNIFNGYDEKEFIPTYEDEFGRVTTEFEAAREFFGINDKAALYFFSPVKYDGNPLPGDVAARIREYVNEL